MINVLEHPDFPMKLKEALDGDLPGDRSHIKMASQLRKQELVFNTDRSKAIHSGVLILLFPKENRLHTAFILRQEYKGVHSGQVSFPGGRYEKEDRSLLHTALREAQEEVNIDPEKVRVLGSLTELYIPPSNFIVLPVVAVADTLPDFIPEKTEVAQIIVSDLSFLFDSKRLKETNIRVRGYDIKAPYFDVKGHVVWGATAMILSELRDVIESIY